MGQLLWRSADPTNTPKNGYHVLQVSSNGPGEKAGLVPYFDFIVKINGQPVEDQNGLVESVLISSVGQEVQLTVFDSRKETYRDVVVVPSDTWGGAGVAGLSIRYCSYEKIAAYVWHVLEVFPNSPAFYAGLQAHTDYVVGSPEVIFSSSEDFFSLVQLTTAQNIPLYVYSSKTKKVRLVSLTPSKDWGGNGTLGCDIGYGYLHQIPAQEEPTAASPPTSPTKAAQPQVEAPQQPAIMTSLEEKPAPNPEPITNPPTPDSPTKPSSS